MVGRRFRVGSLVAVLLLLALTDGSSQRARRRLLGNPGVLPQPQRIGCLHNGYLLTVNPHKATAAADASDRYRLYVLYAVLIDPASGRIMATFPPLNADVPGGVVAKPVADYAALVVDEHPNPPGTTATQLRQYWAQRGIDEALLASIEFVDLHGAVVTPGLVDDHFHVTSWSKKLPAEGERFGFWAEIGDPRYYTDTSTWDRLCVRQSLWEIVVDANRHVADLDSDRIYLHGYWNTVIDQLPGQGENPTHLFTFSPDPGVSDYNPQYLLNRIGTGAGATADPPPSPCTSEPSSWPPLSYETIPVVMVHTSGQACWYNSALLEEYNDLQRETLAAAFGTVTVTGVTPASEGDWVVDVDLDDADAAALLAMDAGFPMDVLVTPSDGAAALTVPFGVLGIDAVNGRLTCRPMLAELAEDAFGVEADGVVAVPFYRDIVEVVSGDAWDAAAAFWGESPSGESVGYGAWDPANPHGTNWYNGAERGLIEYVYDDAADVWRPTGYAEHYVMRDALSALVVDRPTVEQGIEQRRRLATWCHRHGLTAVNDIMFYRRSTNRYEFDACEGLSFDHRFDGARSYYDDKGLDAAVATGGLNLRLGLYYYLENAADISEILALADDGAAGYDVARLRPPRWHPESPGWVRWLGWKLQLDGGVGARTIVSNAPAAKARFDDRFTTEDDTGSAVTFANHSFGLLTMTNVQEQVLTSRETAALYWLVRESDPESAFHNDTLGGDWSFFCEGVVELLDREIDEALLAQDLARLQHVELTNSAAAALAAKLATVQEQVKDG